jgi:hypothetical protein
VEEVLLAVLGCRWGRTAGEIVSEWDNLVNSHTTAAKPLLAIASAQKA